LFTESAIKELKEKKLFIWAKKKHQRKV
jgi:hypothetical protein